MIKFAHPEYLTYLLVVPVAALLLWYVWTRARKRFREYGNVSTLNRLVAERSRVKYWLRSGVYLFAVALLIVGLATLSGLVNASRLKVVRYETDAPVELRIAQISDLHLGSVRPRYARKVVEKVKSAEPDVVVLTGDILDSLHPISTDGLAYLREIAAPVFCVMGNHERYAGLEGAAEVLRGAGFTVLRGDTAEFRGARFIGFDDDPRPSSTAELLSSIDIDPAGYNILLFHHPVGFPDAAEAGIRLMLSGHTHHGQIWPFSLVIRWRFSHPFGLYRHGDATLYTTQGTGTWGPRMRVGTSSEIAVFDLRPAESQE